jgi:RNA polymerase sigma factor (TIGR02999 family)
MRRVLVDHARTRGREKRGGDEWRRITFSEEVPAAEEGGDILAVQEALDRLVELDRRKADIIDLIVFGGLTAKEAAEVLQVSEPTLNRELRMARVWLSHQLKAKPE